MRTTPASRPLAASPAGQDRVVVPRTPQIGPRRGSHPSYLEPVLALLEGLGHAALVLDRRGRIAAETPALVALIDAHPEAVAARSLAPRLLLMEALGGARHTLSGRAREARILAAPVGGLELELRLLPSALPFARGSASVVVVTVRLRAASGEAFLAAHYRLTAREIPVAMLLGQGLSVSCIAERLAISAHTVRRHGESVYRKLGVRSRAALAAAITRVAMMFAAGSDITSADAVGAG